MTASCYALFKQCYLSLSRFRAIRCTREWVRANIQMRYWPWYDRKPRTCGIEKNPAAYERELIVSLTTFPARIHMVHYAIRSLLRQSLKPNRVVLWLGEDKFPGKEEALPKDLLDLRAFGLEIRWCRDAGPVTKLVYSLQTWPEAVIVTADDDSHYPRHWLRTLYHSYLGNPKCIHTGVVHQIRFDASGYPESFGNWSQWHPSKVPLFRNTHTGFSGSVYPPHCLHPDVADVEKFAKLSPTADDFWFWAMAVRAGTKINLVQENRRLLQDHQNPRVRKTPRLWQQNSKGGGNTRCFFQLLQAYPEIVEKLKEERNIID